MKQNDSTSSEELIRGDILEENNARAEFPLSVLMGSRFPDMVDRRRTKQVTCVIAPGHFSLPVTSQPPG